MHLTALFLTWCWQKKQVTWYCKWNSDILYACYSTMLNVWTIIKMHVWCWQLMYWLIKNDDEYAQYVHPRNVCTVKYVAYNVERISCGGKQRVWTILLHRWTMNSVRIRKVMLYTMNVYDVQEWCYILWCILVVMSSGDEKFEVCEKFVIYKWWWWWCIPLLYDDDNAACYDDALLYPMMNTMMKMHDFPRRWL